MKVKLLLLVWALFPILLLAQASGSTQESANTAPYDTLPAGENAYVDTLGVGFWRKLTAPVYPNPERAAAMSFVLPGSGQIYNKRFWYLKVPVIYGGYAFLIYRGETNRKLRNDYQVAYQASLAGETHEFSGTLFDNPQTLRIRRDAFDKNFQLSYIGVVILHLVQTLEAYTTAHLLEFDMDESLSVSPTLLPPDPMGQTGVSPGIRMSVQLGR
jgi:hypothetical protein